MAYEENMPRMEGAHHVILEGREQLSVSGVEEVESFDENTIIMTTVKGTLVVRGRICTSRSSLWTGETCGWRAWSIPYPMRTTAGSGADSSPVCCADMTISVAQQAAALAQAAALGLAVGLLYDLFRVLRVRVALPLLGAVLDLSFWIIVTVALFVWSQQAWRGRSGCTGSSFSLGAGCSISGSSVPGC